MVSPCTSLYVENGSLLRETLVLMPPATAYRNVFANVLDVAQDSTKALLKVLTDAVNAVRDWLADGGPIYIPVISEIYKLITGRKLQFAKALFFMIAIPVTYMSKAILGQWPSQMVSADQMTGAKVSIAAIAGRDLDPNVAG